MLDQTFGARKGLIDESYNQALIKTAMDNHAENATDLNFKYHYGDEETGWPGLLAYQQEYVIRDYKDDQWNRDYERDMKELHKKAFENYMTSDAMNIDKILADKASEKKKKKRTIFSWIGD